MLIGLQPINVVASAEFRPTDISGLFAWYRSDLGVTESGGLVSQWNDQSGNGRNLSEATNKPTYSSSGGPNSYPTIVFDGTNDMLSCTFTALSQPFSAFAVFKIDTMEATSGIICGAASGERIFYMNSTTAMFLYFGSGLTTYTFSNTTNFHVWEALCNTTASRLKYNNDAGITPSIGTGTLTGINMGRLPGFGFAACKITELVVYNRELTGTDLTSIRSYLGTRYGITV